MAQQTTKHPENPTEGKFFNTWFESVVKVRKIGGNLKMFIKKNGQVLDCKESDWKMIKPLWWNKVYQARLVGRQLVVISNNIRYIENKLVELNREKKDKQAIMNDFKQKMTKKQLKALKKEIESSK